jgi:hypothetical protein
MTYGVVDDEGALLRALVSSAAEETVILGVVPTVGVTETGEVGAESCPAEPTASTSKVTLDPGVRLSTVHSVSDVVPTTCEEAPDPPTSTTE